MNAPAQKPTAVKSQNVVIAAEYLVWAIRELFPYTDESPAYIEGFEALNKAYLDHLKKANAPAPEAKSFPSFFDEVFGDLFAPHRDAQKKELEQKLQPVKDLITWARSVTGGNDLTAVLGMLKEASEEATKHRQQVQNLTACLEQIEEKIYAKAGRKMVAKPSAEERMQVMFEVLDQGAERAGQDRVNEIARAFNRVQAVVMGTRDSEDDHTPGRPHDHASRANDMIFTLRKRNWVTPSYERSVWDLLDAEKALKGDAIPGSDQPPEGRSDGN